MSLQTRWFSEPVRTINFSQSSFLMDEKGYPSLPKATRTFLGNMMRLKVPPWLILWDVGPIQEENQSLEGGPTPSEAAEPHNKTHLRNEPSIKCLDHIRDLQNQQPQASEIERYGSGYQDYLQVPLQPLTDNLESMTYEVFEKDPVKYNLYEAAIERALADWSTDLERRKSRPIVTVAGAGRGPLVTRAVKASEKTRVLIDLWVVEKNPNAFVLLQKHQRDGLWGKQKIHLVQADMREWKGPNDKASIDILITELLGSFADNELSPECLDGCCRLLSPKGISIPRSYTPYLTPIAAPKLHADILSRISWDPNPAETPAVVWLHSIDYVSFEKNLPSSSASQTPGAKSTITSPLTAGTPNILPAWTFFHGDQAPSSPSPSPQSPGNKHNERFACLNFRCKHRSVCHGLGGYFESELYPGVELSTNPNTIEQKSADMISWFPIWFPLKVRDNTFPAVLIRRVCCRMDKNRIG